MCGEASDGAVGSSVELDLRALVQAQQAGRGAADGGWGARPPWWLKEKERKKKKKKEHKKRGLELKRKEMQHPYCGDRIGDPYAKKKTYKASGSSAPKLPLAVLPVAPSSSMGTTAKAIPVEEADRPECFKCGRVGHF